MDWNKRRVTWIMVTGIDNQIFRKKFPSTSPSNHQLKQSSLGSSWLTIKSKFYSLFFLKLQKFLSEVNRSIVQRTIACLNVLRFWFLSSVSRKINILPLWIWPFFTPGEYLPAILLFFWNPQQIGVPAVIQVYAITSLPRNGSRSITSPFFFLTTGQFKHFESMEN